MSQGYPFTVYSEPDFRQSSLVLGWNEDVGSLGRRVTDYLRRKLRAEQCAEIEPEDFFTLNGVAVEGNLAQFPESKFYACQERELVVCQSNSPSAEWYRFLNSVLQLAQRHCGIKELYVLGVMVSFSAHTSPRQLVSVVNSPEMKEVLTRYDLATDMDYQTQPGERPTLNSFLLWIARKRNVPGASLWVPIPFYLSSVEDFQAQKRVLTFLNQRLNLDVDLGEVDQRISEQNEWLARARSLSPQIDSCISKLENNLMLSEEESGELMRRIADFLKEGG